MRAKIFQSGQNEINKNIVNTFFFTSNVINIQKVSVEFHLHPEELLEGIWTLL